MLGLVFALASCGDVMDEITSLNLDRNMSPLGLENRNTTENSVDLQWQPVSGAAAYQVQLFADDSLTFEGTPAIDRTTTSTSIHIDGLTYDTKYSARVSALDSADASRQSKWSSLYFRSDAQQILKSITEANTGDKFVILHWKGGEKIDEVRAFTGDNLDQLAGSWSVSDEENADSTKRIEGLNPETNYRFQIYLNGKQRGKRDVQTIADLQGATVLTEGDDLEAAIANAEDGAVIALMPGTFTITGETDATAGSAVIDKNLTIKGIYPTSKPTVKGTFKINGKSFALSNVILDGRNNDKTDQFFDIKEAGNNLTLDVEDCEIIGGEGQKGLIYGNTDQAIFNEVTFKNNLIHGITCEGGDFFDFRKSYVATINFTQNTVWDCAVARDFFRYDDSASKYGNPVPTINVTKNTFYNVMNGDTSGKRFLYIRFNGGKDGQNITWQDNLIVNTKAVYTNQSKTSTPAYKNNYYYGCDNASIFAPSNETADPKVFWNGDTGNSNGENPNFTDPANGNFKVGNETVSKLGVGDPRWIK